MILILALEFPDGRSSNVSQENSDEGTYMWFADGVIKFHGKEAYLRYLLVESQIQGYDVVEIL